MARVIESKKPRFFQKKKPLKVRMSESWNYFKNASGKIKREIILKILIKALTYLLLSIGAILVIFPFYWMLITAFKTQTEANSANPSFWPESGFHWDNFINAWNLKNINSAGDVIPAVIQGISVSAVVRPTLGVWFYNTIVSVVINTILTVLTTILAAFAIAKLNFKGRGKIFGIMLITMMVPGEVLTVQNLVTMFRLGWGNSFAAIIAPFITSVFYIYLLVQLFISIPDSLYKAARVDGCGDWKFLWRVLVPMSANTLATISVLNAISSWNSYLWPSLVNTEGEWYTLTVGLYYYTAATSAQGQNPVPNFTMAATVITLVPMIVIYLLLRKQIIAGVSRSGTKG